MSIKHLTIHVAPDHPAFAGHFPTEPIVPGVVLLDEALHAIGAQLGIAATAFRISSVKFLSPVSPGEPVCLSYDASGSGTLRFEIASGQRKVAAATLSYSQ